MFRWLRTLTLLSMLTACAPVPIGVSGSNPAPSPTAISPTVPAGLFCDDLDLQQLAELTGLPVAIDVASSGAHVCTYNVGARSSAPDYAVAVRVEDTFVDLETVERAFPDGQHVDSVGQGGYWSNNVATLWILDDGAIVAVQLVVLEVEPEDALGLALAVARRLLEGAE